MRVLITGATGFAGHQLSRLLLAKKGVLVYGLVRPSASVGTRGRSASKLERGVKPLKADLLNSASMTTAVRKARPDRVYHLAAQASVAESWKRPKETFRVNVKGTRCVLEAVRLAAPRARVLIAGSADEYGSSARSGRKLTEKAPLVPLSPYAESKVAQDLLARFYHLKFGLHIVRTRAFNHFGPGQDERFVIPSFAKQAAMIDLGLQKPEISVGNLEAVRDFTDARDVMRAYILALEKGRAGEAYNVASGRGRRLSEVLRYYLRRSSVKIRVRQDRARMRAADIRCLVGDASKLSRDTGWKPRIPLEHTLEETLKDWKERLSAKQS